MRGGGAICIDEYDTRAREEEKKKRFFVFLFFAYTHTHTVSGPEFFFSNVIRHEKKVKGGHLEDIRFCIYTPNTLARAHAPSR